MALGELRSTTVCLLAVSGQLDAQPEGSSTVWEEGGKVLVVPDAGLALDSAISSLKAGSVTRASLMLCQLTDESVRRSLDLLNHASTGHLICTLAIQDLLRDSSSGAEFQDIGSLEVRGRVERVFAIGAGIARVRQDMPVRSWRSSGPFVGRRKELDKLSSMLLTSRLLCVNGQAGCGKSALLQRFLDEQESAFESGGKLVDLANVRQSEMVLEAVCRSLDIRQLPGEDKLDALVSTLRDRAALLIFDNCEQALPGVRQLVGRLLHECSQLAIVVGSRKMPRIAGEARYRLLGLETPAYAEDWRAIKEYDAVVLFEERAKAAEAEFTVNDKNAADVAQLCERLDGNPLAIELVASKVSVLAPRQILGRLEDRFLLFKDSAGRNPLEETLNWTYENLEPAARQLLNSLSLFRGSFSIDTAAAISGGIELAEHAILWSFEELVDNSLLIPAASSPSQKQFYLPETVRGFASRKFASSPKKAQVQKRYNEWCLSFAREAEDQLYGPDQADWLEALDGAYQDLRAVIAEGCLPKGDVSVAAKTLIACFPYFVERSYFREARALAEKVSSVRGASRLPEYPRLLTMAGSFSFYLGDWRECRRYAARAVRAARRSGDPMHQGNAWCTLGLAAHGTAHYVRARKCYLKAAEHMRGHDEKRLLTVLSNAIAIEAEIGLYDSAEAHLNEAKDLLERCTDLGAASAMYLNGSHFHLVRGDLAQSWAWAYRCVLAGSRLGASYTVLLGVRGLIQVLAGWGEYRWAAELIGWAQHVAAKAESEPLDEGGLFEEACNRVRERLGGGEYLEAALQGQAWDEPALLEVLTEMDAQFSRV